MRLRDALDLCTDRHSDDWVRMPGSSPANYMLAAMFDPGAAEPQLRPLVGHTIAVYEPDPRLSMVWPVPSDDDLIGRVPDSYVPDWVKETRQDFKSSRSGFAVILLGGAPIWQEVVRYLEWGSGIGGYVPEVHPRFHHSTPGRPEQDGWQVSAWEVGLARLLNVFSATGEFYSFDPTLEAVPKPDPTHPIDAARREY